MMRVLTSSRKQPSLAFHTHGTVWSDEKPTVRRGQSASQAESCCARGPESRLVRLARLRSRTTQLVHVRTASPAGPSSTARAMSVSTNPGATTRPVASSAWGTSARRYATTTVADEMYGVCRSSAESGRSSVSSASAAA